MLDQAGIDALELRGMFAAFDLTAVGTTCAIDRNRGASGGDRGASLIASRAISA